MLFSSLIFLWFFLPALMLIYTLSPGRNLKNAVLLTASLLFYGFGEPKYIILLVLTIFNSYVAGLLINAFKNLKYRQRAAAAACILFQLGMLGYFKYYNFLADTINRVASGELLPLRDISLPLGISFYTFQAISYIADTLKKKNPSQKNLFHLAVYICLFPQLLSGPIIKYHELAGQITERTESLSMMAYGIRRFTYGLAKKVLLANTFGQTVDRMTALPAVELGTGNAWLLVFLYSLQIYYDFSGYSDMAVGLGRMFGFRYAENFDYPYLSSSITEFWRRWHISLSTWFREYLYIPLGGNRKGLLRTCLNLSVVFLATGLWHGASMNFIGWGIYHGFFIILERFWLGNVLKKNRFTFLNHLYALGVVLFGWLLFRVNDMEASFTLLKAMLIPTAGLWDVRIFAGRKILFAAFAGVLLCGPLQMLMPRLKNHLFDEEHCRAADIAVMVILLLLSTTVIVSSTYNAFIYFKF